jgi:hypothetical protein
MENPADDLHSTLSAAFEQAEKPVETTQEATREAPPADPAQESRPRDEHGRFAKAESTAEAPQQAEQPPAPPPAAPEVKAPSSWKPEAQQAYVKAAKGEPLTPEEIKLLTAEAERRESDYHKGIEGLKPNAQLGRQFQEVLQPYMQTIQQLGVDAPTAVAKLFQTEHILRYGDPATKAQMFANLAQQYGVDLGQLANAPQVDPQVQYLQQQLAQTQGQVHQFFTQQQQQQHAQVMSEIEKFASDPANAHFEAVRDEMAVLLQTGKAQDLKSAYDMAVWMRPDTRQSLIEQQRAEAQRQAQEQAQAARAKAASVGVKGSSPVAAVAAPAGDSVRDAILAAFDQT